MALFLKGRAEAARAQRRLAAWAAWHAGVLSQVADIPPLEKMLGDDQPAKPVQTPDEQFAIAMLWNARVGGEVVKREGSDG